MNPVVRIVANGPQGPFALCGLTENLLQIPPLGAKDSQPLTPPWMTPFSILSWKKGKAMMIGAMAAMMTANWIR